MIRQEWQVWRQTVAFTDDTLRASVVASFEQVIPRFAIPAAQALVDRLSGGQP